MKEKVFNVEGMSCNHCVAAVKEAVEGVEGVESCAVDLAGKTATVVLSEDVQDADIKEAIEEEGFEVV